MLRRRSDQPLRFFPQRIVADGEFGELTILNNSAETITWRLALPLWLDAISNNHANYFVDNDGRRWLDPSAPLLPEQTDNIRFQIPENARSADANAALTVASFSSDGHATDNTNRPVRVAHTRHSQPTKNWQSNGTTRHRHSSSQRRTNNAGAVWRWLVLAGIIRPISAGAGAQSPATLWVYSVRNCDSTMTLSFSELLDPTVENWRVKAGNS